MIFSTMKAKTTAIAIGSLLLLAGCGGGSLDDLLNAGDEYDETYYTSSFLGKWEGACIAFDDGTFGKEELTVQGKNNELYELKFVGKTYADVNCSEGGVLDDTLTEKMVLTQSVETATESYYRGEFVPAKGESAVKIIAKVENNRFYLTPAATAVASDAAGYPVEFVDDLYWSRVN